MGAMCSSAATVPVPLSPAVVNDSPPAPQLEQHAAGAQLGALPALCASIAAQAATHSAQAQALLAAISDGELGPGEAAAGVAALADAASALAVLASSAAAASAGAAPPPPATALPPLPLLCLGDVASEAVGGAANAGADADAAADADAGAGADADAAAGGGADAGVGADAGASEQWQDDPIGLHVLLVDDQAAIRRVGETFLRQIGCTVDLLSDGDEVDAALAQPRRVDAIVMDLIMRRSDGSEVCRALRERGCTLPIVAITAYSTLRAAADLYCSGFDVVRVSVPSSVRATNTHSRKNINTPSPTPHHIPTSGVPEAVHSRNSGAGVARGARAPQRPPAHAAPAHARQRRRRQRERRGGSRARLGARAVTGGGANHTLYFK